MNPLPNHSVDIIVDLKFFEELKIRLWLLFRVSIVYAILAVVCGVALLTFVGEMRFSKISDIYNKTNLENLKYILYILVVVAVVFVWPLVPFLKKTIFNEKIHYNFSKNGFEVDKVYKNYSDISEFLETRKEFIFNNHKLGDREAYIIPKRCLMNEEEMKIFNVIWQWQKTSF
jgi:hypothetical protein